MSIECSGWLEIKRKRKFVVLCKSILCWFKEEITDRQLQTEVTGGHRSTTEGSLNLEEVSTVNSIHEEGTCVGLELLIEEGGTVELLTSLKATKDSFDLTIWEKALSTAITLARKEVKLAKESGAYKTGWLERKNQKQFFILKCSHLISYTRPRDGIAQWTLDLKFCTASISKLGFTITSSYTEKKYDMKCSYEEALEWLRVISNAKWTANEQECERVNATARLFAALQFKAVSHSGILELNGKSFFFVIDEKHLNWYKSSEEYQTEQKPEGNLNLQESRIIYLGGNTFSLQTPQGKSMSFKALSSNQAQSWISTIQVATGDVC
eukprot:TRINITY_DN7760_c0_g1_i2.p1 TRINITY_DN7760_c0_g1~~TRINITY_DN7760_c0_g1_i2.p1  ORF type:complete len:324 (-),score=66.57 TRINITY_DN7760_c0_g1_i2:479-1450(-)